MSAKARRLSKKELRNKAASQRDPLQELRRSVQSRQGLVTRASSASSSNRGLVDYLMSNVSWSKLLPLIIPLVLSMLRRKQNATSQSTQQIPAQSLGGIGSQTGASQMSPSLIGLLGSLLGSSAASQTQAQPQADAMGGLLQTLSGAQGTQTQPQAGDLGGLLQALSGAQETQAQPQAGSLGGLLQALSGAQGTQTQPQADALTGLLQTLSGSRATQFEQDRAWRERGPAAGAQTGSVLRLLGTAPQSQRTAEVNPLMDVLANNMDLDGDGVPDALEQMLSPQADDDIDKNGAAALLEGMLDNASAEDLTAFSRSVQELLSPA